MSAIRNAFVKLDWLLSSQFGIAPRSLVKSIGAIPRYVRDWRRFRRMYSGSMTLWPCLHDWDVKADATHNEYFWQDLLVAQWIFEGKPRKHVDVGSRIDGFIAHVASFREVEMFDVRPVSRTVPGVTFKQADMMQPLPGAVEGYCDSLSCLHAIEHFGLGRYGDPLDPIGYERGLANLAQLVAAGGALYLSTPIGRERVEFNAGRVFDPRTIIRCAQANRLQLERLTLISAGGVVTREDISDPNLLRLAQADYNLGLFTFRKADR
jgi:Caenorhabditis protein of unknown function, DUF268